MPKSIARRQTILKNKVYFLVENDENIAICLAAFLNSTPIRVFLQSFCGKARGGWFFHYSWLHGMMGVLNSLKSNIPPQEKLDKLIGMLYGLSERDIDVMRSFHTQITSDARHPIENEEGKS